MENAETIASEYLEAVLKFKARAELHEDYLPPKKREKLLKELTLELGFSEEVWRQRKEAAEFYFEQMTLLRMEPDYELIAKGAYYKAIEKLSLKAIHLDPFNEVFLSVYLFENHVFLEPKKHYAQCYFCLFEPDSAKSSDIAAELGLSVNDLDFDYLNTKTLQYYVNELVFLIKNPEVPVQMISSDELKQVAIHAGVEAETLQKIDEGEEEMIEVVRSGFNLKTDDWKQLHKSYLMADRLIKLAPYNRDAIYAAMRFYGGSCWKMILKSVRHGNGNPEACVFFQSALNNQNPTRAEKLELAKTVLDKAYGLYDRLSSIPEPQTENEEDGEVPLNTDIQKKVYGLSTDSSNIRAKAFIVLQSALFQVHSKYIEFKRKNDRIIIGSMAVLIVLCVFLIQYNVGNMLLFLPLLIVPITLGLIIGYLHGVIWRSGQIDFTKS